jgi:hypothetical protein
MTLSVKPIQAALLVAMLAAPLARAQDGRLLYDRLQRDAGAEFNLTPLGLCEDYPEETTTREIYVGDMDMLRRMDVDLLRISFGWDGIEGEKDRYDWLFWDDYVETAVDEYGVTLIPYICYTPHWNSTTDDIENSWHFPPKDYEEWGEFVFDLVSRYRDRIKTWELWNEPDIWIYWAGTHEEFARMIRIGSEAVRRADPEAKVVLGGLAHDAEWLETLFRDHGVSPYVDIVNMHNYYETWVDHPLEDLADYIRTVRDIVSRYGDDQALWMAEVGYSTFRDGAYVSDGYTAYYEYEHTPAYQAVDLVRRITTALSTDLLSALTWYEMKDLTRGEATIGDFGNNGNLGVATARHEPKPAEGALAFFNGLLREPMRSIDGEVAVTRTIGSDAVVHAFEQEDGDVIVVGWLRTMVPGRRGNPGDGMARDDRTETVSVTVPRGIDGNVRTLDELGRELSAVPVSRDGAGTALELQLSGGGVVIVTLDRE